MLSAGRHSWNKTLKVSLVSFISPPPSSACTCPESPACTKGRQGVAKPPGKGWESSQEQAWEEVCPQEAGGQSPAGRAGLHPLPWTSSVCWWQLGEANAFMLGAAFPSGCSLLTPGLPTFREVVFTRQRFG